MKPISVKYAINGDYWQLWWKDPTSGKRRKKSGGPRRSKDHPDGLNERGIKVMAQRLAVELSSSENPSSKTTLGQWTQDVIESFSNRSEGTLYLYGQTRKSLIMHFGSDAEIAGITPRDAAGWHARLRVGDFTKNKPSEYTVAQRTRDAKSFFNQAIKAGHISHNPFSELTSQPPRRPKSWPQITPEHTEQWRAAINHPDLSVLVALCRYAGVRRHEAIGLEWSYVRFDSNRLLIRPTDEQGRYVEDSKHGLREPPIVAPKVPSPLREILENHPRNGKYVLSAMADKNGLIRSSWSGNVYRDLNVAHKRAGLGEIHKRALSVLRKNHISALLMHYPKWVVTEWCGHTDDVEEEFYSKVPDELY